jgi:hypothetical protein
MTSDPLLATSATRAFTTASMAAGGLDWQTPLTS